ncbi:MAG: ImmA/IrrE family metallo-endopeptidase [Victivallales bacterium]|nr:ImmA/IrrE family metallo-endopeptidase [Victivallales bacterium]
MVLRVDIQPGFILWACERARLEPTDLYPRFKKLPEWERGESKPTMKQLEDFANATHTPIGYFFLPEPPKEKIPIPDLRTIRGQPISHPSPDLLDTLYAMQRRQAWLREDLIDCEAESLDFAGSARVTDDPQGVGLEMRRMVGLADGWAARVGTWREAVSELRRSIEELGVTAVINGVVGNNTHRKLDVDEFRGFALSDEFAPLVFVNGADAKSAQMFTLIHELAHIWLGESALTDTGLTSQPTQQIESWCDQAAAEFLVPAEELRACWRDIRHDESPFETIARRFKVSPIVAGRRAMDLRLVSREAFFRFYEEHIAQERKQRSDSGGGDFYSNQNTRIGELFATQVILAAKGGRVSFKEAYDLTGLSGGAFQEYADRLGVTLP